MAENQLEGTEKANEMVSEETIDGFNAIFKDILKAWNLIPSQDRDGIGKLHNEVVEICKNIDNIHDKNGLFRLLRYLVKVPYHLEEGLRFNLLGKLESSFKNYKEADHFCDCVLQEFLKTENTMDKKLVSIFPIFKFIEYCCYITKVLKEDSYNTLEYEEGKSFTCQVERFRGLAGHFRKFSTDLVSLNNKNEKLNEEFNNMSILAKRVADMCEEKAEKIEADNKNIEFMKPIDKKVFIVHGHNDTILRELKEILKNYDIEPVILYRKSDDGKVIIEKFEHEARYSGFAFVIMTKDDFVTVIKDKETYEQGRPNVFFELGWFCGRYGRKRVRIIKEEDAKIPTDLEGILTINFIKNLKENFIAEVIKKDLEHSGIILACEKNNSEKNQE